MGKRRLCAGSNAREPGLKAGARQSAARSSESSHVQPAGTEAAAWGGTCTASPYPEAVGTAGSTRPTFLIAVQSSRMSISCSMYTM